MACALGGLLASGAALAGRVDVASSSASSEYASDKAEYASKKAHDGKVSTGWAEGDKSNGPGEWIELDLGGEKEVSKLVLWSGNWFSTSLYSQTMRPNEIEVTFDGGESEKFSVPDEMKAFTYTLPSPRKASKLKLTVRSVHTDGAAYPDTTISEVHVYDTSPAAMAPVASMNASSTAAADADGNYDAMNLVDGNSDTMWCEGNSGSDGSGEWVEWTFKSKQQVGTLHLNNGIGTSLKYFMKGNRLAKATLEFGDGSTQTVDVKNSMLPQKVAFTPVTTDTVKMKMDGITKGKEFDDLCLSEAYFSQ
jgi:hypothetical protein